MARSVPISVRISDDDAAFLARYKADGAKTPSEKLRAILGDARKLNVQPEDFSGCTEMLSSLLRPSQNRLRSVQHEEGLRSDLLAKLYERLPELVASLMLGPQPAGNPADELVKFEDAIAQQTFALIEDVLNLGLTTVSRTYSPALIKTRLEPILEILDLVRLSNSKQEG
jgi:hypothetical protein